LGTAVVASFSPVENRVGYKQLGVPIGVSPSSQGVRSRDEFSDLETIRGTEH
jgi:hypothetical protein